MKTYIIFLMVLTSYISQAQWHQTNGPFGGQISSFATKGDTIYAISVGGSASIYISTNKGKNWKLLKIFPIKVHNSNITIKGNYIIAGFGIPISEGEEPVSIPDLYLSSDNGENWSEIKYNSNGKNKHVYCITVIDDKIFLGTAYGIYLSNDDGINWQYVEISDSMIYNTFYSITFHNNIIFAGNRYGLYKSSDLGESWTESGIKNERILSIVSSGNNLLAGTNHGVYLSTNNGENWRNAGLYNINTYSLASKEDLIFAGTDDGIYLTTNNGIIWSKLNTGSKNFTVRTIFVNEDLIFAGTEIGILVSMDNGVSWAESNSGITATSISDIQKKGTNYYTGTYQNGVYISTDSGENWESANTLHNSFTTSAILTHNNKIFAGTFEGIFVSNDSGTSWTEKNSGLMDNYKWIQSFAAKDDKIFVGLQNGGIFVSSDEGENWNDLKVGSYNSVESIEIIDNNIYACTQGSGIFVSSDNGATWVEKNTGFITNKIKVRKLSATSNKIYAATDQGLYVSEDKGENWIEVNPEFREKFIFALETIESNIFISYYNVALYSKDFGRSWTEFSDDLNGNTIMKFKIIDDTIYALTSGSGIYKSKLDDLDIISSNNFNIEEMNYIYSYPPYPMPASNEVRTLIYWDSSIDIENDEILVYNIYGLKIEGKEKITIDRINSYSGYLVWDCSIVPSGIYLINIKHGTESRTIKTIVVK